MNKSGEVTSKKVAAIAGRVLSIRRKFPTFEFEFSYDGVPFTWDDIEALAASALTQAPDKWVRDATGARRVWPVKAAKATKDLDYPTRRKRTK